MALLIAPDEPKVLANQSPAAPVLRVRQRGAETSRTAPLAIGKCTIGSSPQCQVCLPTPEVRPLQCLITLESDAAIVTRWATGVQLNGRDFSKAQLHSGDWLTIGSWEIEFAWGGCTPNETTDYADEVVAALQSELQAELTPSLSLQSPLTALPELPSSVAVTAPDVIDQPAVIAPMPVVSAKPGELSNSAGDYTSHAFADSLVLQLWTAKYGARRRAKALITGIRAARFHAEAMAADIAAMETELDLARAAYDSHLGNDDRVQHELAEHRREHEERVAPLLEEVAALRLQLEHATADISRQTAEYRKLSAELADLRNVPATPLVDEQLARRAEALEATAAAQSQQLEKLKRDLQSAQLEQQRLAELYRAETQRTAEYEQALLQQQESSLASAAAGAPAVASEVIEPSADPWAGVAPIIEEAARAAAPVNWDAFAPAADEVDSSSLAAISDANAPLADEASHADADEFLTVAEEVPVEAVAIQPRPLTAEVSAPVRDVEESPTPVTHDEATPSPPWAAPAEEKAASSTSFIDKYRHLLDDNDTALPLVAPKGSRPVIDDEFLSPAKAETCASPADESDEALEAYMANMMRRVRSTSPSYESSQAVAAAVPAANESKSPIAHFTRPSVQAGAPNAITTTPDFLAEEPFSFEALKSATRKLPLASDLAALREIANSSARTAIATHSHKRSHESAVSKIAIGLTALASSAFLMASAPELNSWMFWGGAATGTIGIVAAVQVLLLERRRATDKSSAGR